MRKPDYLSKIMNNSVYNNMARKPDYLSNDSEWFVIQQLSESLNELQRIS